MSTAKPTTKGMLLHEVPPGTIKTDDPAREQKAVLFRITARREIELYKLSSDGNHLWRAWRTMRAMGFDADLFAEIAPHLDELAVEESDSDRATQRSTRHYILREYYRQLERKSLSAPSCAKNLTDLRARVAKAYKTTEGAVKQIVMEFEGRGQRGGRRRR